MNTSILGYLIAGVCLLLGLFGSTLALLYLRIRRLSLQLKGKDQQIRSTLSVDPLTGLVNRTAFYTAGERLLQTQTEQEVSLVILDLNRFRALNDAFGHVVADELLRQVGQRLQTQLGQQDLLARTGDNEFSLLLSPGDETRTYQIAERILSSIHQPFRIQSQLVRVQGRAGIALAEKGQGETVQEYLPEKELSNFSELLMRANIAISQMVDQESIKANSRASSQLDTTTSHIALGEERQYRVYRPEMKSAIASKVGLQQSMAAALEHQQLQVRYQAIVDIKTGETIGFEALVRWQHPELGLLGPDDFLPIAEELGLSFKIDRWVLDKVCQQLVSWRAEGLSPSISVNLSGSHLSRADLVEYIRGLIASYAIKPGQLSVEVTESVAIADLDQGIRTLMQLKSLGVGISLDDFGTGYSSFNYLRRFPVDVLKIDRSFIRCLGQSAEDCPIKLAKALGTFPRQDELIVSAILSLASALEIRVVVEGVERLDQWQSLQKMDCGYVQGNYFSKAMEAECARALLRDKV